MESPPLVAAGLLTLVVWLASASALIVVFVVSVLLLLWWLVRRMKNRSTPAEPEPSEERFSDRAITGTFRSALPTLTPELHLEVASSRQLEVFRQSDQRTAFWGCLDLGTNEAELRVPVTYRYRVSLRQPWRLGVRRGVVLVHAPPLEPALPVAIDTSVLEQHLTRGWLRLPPADLAASTLRELSPVLERLARDPQRLQLVRETARASVAGFVRQWLVREGRWGRNGFQQVHVTFSDESIELEDPSGPRRTLPDRW